MRGSTAAGINISLLPQDAAAGNLPVVLYGKRSLFGVCWISGSAVWGRDLSPGICVEFADGAILEKASFWRLRGICRKRLCGSAIREKASFLWYLLDFR